MTNCKEGLGLNNHGDENSSVCEHPVDHVFIQETSSDLEDFSETNCYSKSQIPPNTNLSPGLSTNSFGRFLPSFQSLRSTFDNSSKDHKTQSLAVDRQHDPLFQSCSISLEAEQSNAMTDFCVSQQIVTQLNESSVNSGTRVNVDIPTTNLHHNNSNVELTSKTNNHLVEVADHSTWSNNDYANPVNNHTPNIHDYNRSILLAPEVTVSSTEVVGNTNSISYLDSTSIYPSNSLNDALQTRMKRIFGNSCFDDRSETTNHSAPSTSANGTSSLEALPDELINLVTKMRDNILTETDEQNKERNKKRVAIYYRKYNKKRNEDIQLKIEEQILKSSVAVKETLKSNLRKKITIMERYLEKI